MAYQKKPNTGALFVNERQRPGQSDPDRSGDAVIGGVEYYVSGWLKEKDGKKYLSLAFKPKNGNAAAGGSSGNQKKADF